MAIRTVLCEVVDDKLCFMKIGMTIYAKGEFHFVTGWSFMAIVAADNFMFTDERKFCSAVIECCIINLLEAGSYMAA